MTDFIDKCFDRDGTPTRWFFASLATISLIIFSFAATAWVTKSHFEAQTFNRLTGAKTSTWDAMWVQLRVQMETDHETGQ